MRRVFSWGSVPAFAAAAFHYSRGAAASSTNARFCSTTTGNNVQSVSITETKNNRSGDGIPPDFSSETTVDLDLSQFSQADQDILKMDPAAVGRDDLFNLLQKLSSSGEVPSMLQYNEGLAQATLSLLNRSSEFELSAAEESSLSALTEWLMPLGENKGALLLHEQYRLVSGVLSHPQFKSDDIILESCRLMVHAIAPPALYNLFCEVDLEDLVEEDGAEAEVVFHDFMATVLHGATSGGGEEEGNNPGDDGGGGLAPTAAFTASLAKLEATCKSLFKSEEFLEDLTGMKGALIECRLYELVMVACRKFDTTGTGTVKLEELKSSLGDIIGVEDTENLLANCEVNEDGKVFYPQMAKVLMTGTSTEEPM